VPFFCIEKKKEIRDHKLEETEIYLTKTKTEKKRRITKTSKVPEKKTSTISSSKLKEPLQR